MNTKTKKLSTASMVLCGMFAALVAIGAFIQIPVPYMDYFTLQFFFVLLAGFVAAYAIGIVYKFIILNFYAHTPATLGVIFLSCFPLDMPGDFVLCLLASGVGLRMRKSGFYLS